MVKDVSVTEPLSQTGFESEVSSVRMLSSNLLEALDLRLSRFLKEREDFLRALPPNEERRLFLATSTGASMEVKEWRRLLLSTIGWIIV